MRIRGETLKKKTYSVKEFQFLFILFHLLAVIYAVIFLHPYYASNDEFSLAAIASGAYGDYTHYFIYLHSGFALLMKFFYTLFPNVNCYTFLMYAMIFISLSVIGCIWIKKAKRTGMILSMLLILCSISPLYVEMQYTKTAAIVTTAAYVVLFCSPYSKKLSTILGSILLLFGSFIRFQAFGMVSILAFGFWLTRAWHTFKHKNWKTFFLKDCLPCIFAFALVFGSIALENVLVYTEGSAEAHYKEYDKARQQLLDYGVPEWNEYQEEYEALGLTRTDCINLQNWLIADYDRYTADTFQAIVAFRQARPFQWEYLLDYLIILVKKPLFLLAFLGTLLWLWATRKEKKDLCSMLYPYVALLGIYLYFIKIYRVLPIVVTACLLSFLIFVWSLAEDGIANKLEETFLETYFFRSVIFSCILTGGICIRMLITPIFQPAAQESEVSVAFRELYDTISADKDLYYVFDPFTNNGVELAYSIFEKIPDHYLTNIFTLGGWETESPQVVENLSHYEQRSLLTSLYQSDRAVLISNTLMEHIMLHLQDIYDGIFITYSKVNEIGNFDLFTLNYKMSGLKETEDYHASLDRTYTAEHERYDVFEATVDMSPEELDGKSVFLWMESKESGKKRMYQGTWQQQDAQGLYTLLYDKNLTTTNQVKFTIPKMSFPLDDRYEVRIVIRDSDKGTKIVTENLLYRTEE